MNASLSDLEKDIEASRARLDETIDRIQNRLTPVNLVDEMLGSARATPLNSLYDSALETVRKNPLPVLLIVAGIGMLLRKMPSGKVAAANPEATAGIRPIVRAPSQLDPEAVPINPATLGNDPAARS